MLRSVMKKFLDPSSSHTSSVDDYRYKQTWTSSTSTLTNAWDVTKTTSKFDQYAIDEKTGRPLDRKLSRALEYKLEKISRRIYKKQTKLSLKTSQVFELVPERDVNIEECIQKTLDLLKEIDDLERDIEKLSLLQVTVREHALNLSDIDQQRNARQLDRIIAAFWKCAVMFQTKKDKKGESIHLD
ncbi:hypothetical protein AAP_03742 [Ascosphaera apis ARSEF 7405]|uniref:Uncharacterized protein n=1 Tax=Ascosphaera apis ARSEF 7405 TaxID=392613 RepID=A0A167XYW0_9EURO|nr:hypothetical protein AAP_03742 [Ascosphaera apis ARSEF 7405]